MLKGLLEQYEETEIDENEKKFQYLSNYNRFQAAKDQGKITTDLKTMLKLLKYERTHSNRSLMIRRLFSLAMSEYKVRAWESFIGDDHGRTGKSN